MSEEASKYHVESNNETDTPEFPESQISCRTPMVA